MLIEQLDDGAVWLSPPAHRDIDDLARICQHSSLADWIGLPVPYTRLEAERFVEQTVPQGWANRTPTWAIRTAPDGPVAGSIGLVGREEPYAEIGYWLAPRYRSRGLATTAMNLVCAFGFRTDTLALHRIEWRAFVGNHASARVARRAGFRFEGTLRGAALHHGTVRDCWIAGRLRGDPSGPAPGWPDGVGAENGGK